MKTSEKEENNQVKTLLNIATVGSKNRVCLPPTTCQHMGIEMGDHLAFILKYTKKDKKPYAISVNVKAEHFEIEEEPEEIGQILK